MANFDLVGCYNKKDAGDLRNRKLPHPKLRAKNQMPTTADLRWALDSLERASYDRWPYDEDGELVVQDEEADNWIRIDGFDWTKPNSIPGDSFTVYGRGTLTLAILIKLCERCGQLFLYPDSGEPPIILDASMDANEVNSLHQEANEYEDSWSFFFEEMYGSK
jgi:hypothetical protein